LEARVAGQRIGYVRVSALDQNEKRQLEGQILDRVFTDKASGRDTARPQLTELLNLMLSVMGAFAEFERSLIKERQKEGIALAKQRGPIKGGKRPSRRNGPPNWPSAPTAVHRKPS
jgi:DNA invertase Pin-like site-specific DNA recombinase